ncbi:N-acetylglucosaminyldiphosphodolichol N-acetylglucosaminyltransferase anchoring subunit [Martiniozyma asiatica (nom. inval.)]|nr:N-acetylglucosaminyldiphosphodolichol N-acetylglucosaminyltransferase anchoring subunit [Martiniozyma asiatica]
MDERAFAGVAGVILLLLIGFLVRLLLVVPFTARKLTGNVNKFKFKSNSNGQPKLIILLGSGGHTSEMIRIISQFKEELENYQSNYIVTSGDGTSVASLHNFNPNAGVYQLHRARSVHASISSTIGNTIVSQVESIRLVYKIKPDLLLCNGPGSCICLALAMLLRRFFTGKGRILYIESAARVSRLSISGQLMQLLADRFVVQWAQLANGRRRECGGLLV